MAREFIEKQDSLNQGREKLNRSITRAYEADAKSDEAIKFAKEAKHTTFLEQGKNLFNKDEVVYGQILNSNGTIANDSSNNWGISDFIPVNPNTEYIWGTARSTSNSTVVFYREENADSVISGLDNQPKVPFTTPQSANYVRLKVWRAFADHLQFGEGSAQTPHESFRYFIENFRVDEHINEVLGVHDSTTTPIYENGRLVRVEERKGDKLVAFTELSYTNGKVSSYRELINEKVVHGTISDDLTITKIVEGVL